MTDFHCKCPSLNRHTWDIQEPSNSVRFRRGGHDHQHQVPTFLLSPDHQTHCQVHSQPSFMELVQNHRTNPRKLGIPCQPLQEHSVCHKFDSIPLGGLSLENAS